MLGGMDPTQKENRVMALNLVAPTNFPRQLQSAAAPLFILGMNSAGLWVIRETTGRKGGLFRSRALAIKYARDESFDGNFTILHQPTSLELEPGDLRQAA
jgi:hypothetical protein